MTREEAISIMNVIVHMLEPQYDTDRIEDAVEMAIKALEQEPKTGHWILEIEDWNKWTCSECGFRERTDIHVTLGYHYCPNCGAKIEREKKE